jgi:hypothetical protein
MKGPRFGGAPSYARLRHANTRCRGSKRCRTPRVDFARTPPNNDYFDESEQPCAAIASSSRPSERCSVIENLCGNPAFGLSSDGLPASQTGRHARVSGDRAVLRQRHSPSIRDVRPALRGVKPEPFTAALSASQWFGRRRQPSAIVKGSNRIHGRR